MHHGIAIIVTLLCLNAFAGEFPPKGFTAIETIESDSGGFSVIHYKQDPDRFDSESQIWVHALKPEFKDQLLYTHQNRSQELISEDEEYIAINHHELSGLGRLIVFSRNSNGTFDEVKVDFLKVVREQVKQRLKLDDTGVGFDHEYCYADCWLRDGLLLGHLKGDMSGEIDLREWYFIYDVRRSRFVSKINQMNRGVYFEHQWVRRKKKNAE